MKEGTVEKLEKKQTNGSELVKMTIDGQKMSFFSDSKVELGEIEEGDRVKFETERNDGFTNIVELGLIEKKKSSKSDESVEMAVWNATKSLAQLRSEEMGIEEFIEERDKLAESSLETIREMEVSD